MITVGSSVKLKSDQTKFGIVVEIENQFANVNYDNKNQWIKISDLEEKSDDLVSKLTKHDCDDPLDFMLSMDAYRLLVAQAWSPYVLASSTKIQMFPHQIDEVMWALDNSKIMIADEVGLGKTIIAALVVSELKLRGLVKRALFVVPKSLILKWKDELEDRFDTPSEIINSEFVKIIPDLFNKEEYTYVVSMDTLKQESYRKKIIEDVDIVVVDEAHKFVPGTERFDLGEILAEKSHFMIFLTATPHDGKDEYFLARMRLLDPYVSDVYSSSYLWSRNIKENVINIEGKSVFPSRESNTVEIEISVDEQEIFKALDRYLKQLSDQAITPKDQNAIRFLKIIFTKRASSSIYSLKISLEKRLERLGQTTIEQVFQAERGLRDYDDDMETDQETFLDENLGFTTTRDIEGEKASIREIISKIESINQKDSKYEELLTFIEKQKTKDKTAKVVIFSEYRNTVDYLISKLSEKYKTGRIDGQMNIEDRKKELDNFKNPQGIEILVCTDAAGEGIDMQFCNIEFNYDLPWNPNRLEQRMGRIHRIGQTRPVSYFNFILKYEGGIDGYIMSRLLAKIEAIKIAMNDKVYDVIGNLIKQEDIVKLYQELEKIPIAKWEPKMMEFWDVIETNKKKIIQQSELLLTGHKFDKTRLEPIQNIRKNAVDKGEVKRFLEIIAETKEGSFKMVDPKEEICEMYLPSKLALLTNVAKLEGTFDAEVSQRTGWPHIALGNKTVNMILKNTQKYTATVLRHPTKRGLIGIYKMTINNGLGKAQNAQILALFHNEDGNIQEIETRSLWSYEEGKCENINTNLLVTSQKRLDEKSREFLEKFKDETAKKILKSKKTSQEIVYSYLANEIAELDSRIKENQQKMGEGPHVEKIIKKLQANKITKNEKAQKRLEDIEKEYVAISMIEPIGLAVVEPELGSNIRKEIEMAGMNFVIKYEKENAPTEEDKLKILDVSARDSGYDIESYSHKCIEVKSFKTTDSVSLTSHEWETAKRLKDDYWLYVVETALDNPKLTIRRNPYEKFKDKVRIEKVTTDRFIIDSWKEE